jgi:hypothetical protein
MGCAIGPDVADRLACEASSSLAGGSSKGAFPEPRAGSPIGTLPGTAGSVSVAALAFIAVAWDSSVGTLMFAFLAEGIFLPLLAAYLITLVATLVFALSRGEHDDPEQRFHIGKKSR